MQHEKQVLAEELSAARAVKDELSNMLKEERERLENEKAETAVAKRDSEQLRREKEKSEEQKKMLEEEKVEQKKMLEGEKEKQKKKLEDEINVLRHENSAAAGAKQC